MHSEPSNSFLLLKPLLVLFLSGLLVGCGVLIGNPEDEVPGFGSPGGETTNDSAIDEGDVSLEVSFDEVLEDYLSSTLNQEPDGVDCGLFGTDATEEEYEFGRQCLKDAFSSCKPAKLFIEKVTNEDGEKYVSFARVIRLGSESCSIKVRTASNDDSIFVGDITKTCESILEDELPEFACGIFSE